MFQINNLDLQQPSEHHYELRNFYKYPDLVTKFLDTNAPFVHGWGEQEGSCNIKTYIDLRHAIPNDEFAEVEFELFKKLDGETKFMRGKVLTNYMKFIDMRDKSKDNYFWPHVDNGRFNCIIYLNKDPCDGTNLYKPLKEPKQPELQFKNPWVSKEDFELKVNIKAEYNKLVIFSSDMPHGAAFASNRFHEEFRKNQVIFIE